MKIYILEFSNVSDRVTLGLYSTKKEMKAGLKLYKQMLKEGRYWPFNTGNGFFIED